MAANSGEKFDTSKFVNNVCFRYIPIAGGVSSLAFSSNVMNPGLFKSLFSPGEYVVANCLWFNAHLGAGLYLYGREHMRRAPSYYRIMYSVYGSVLFNFGSVLFWATTKQILPKCNHLRVFFGIATGIAAIIIGREYIHFIDRQVGNALSEE